MMLDLLKIAQVWRCKDLVVLTDLARCEDRDAVFPVCAENIMFAERLRVHEGDRVLDLGTGSGFLALVASRTAAIVVATDINPRAVRFARANVALNGLQERIDVRQGDLFEPVPGQRFDCILANPPFEPTPANRRQCVHSDGGRSGLVTTVRILARAAEHLVDGGILQLLTYVPDADALDDLASTHYLKLRIESLGKTRPTWVRMQAGSGDVGVDPSARELPVYLLTLQSRRGPVQ